LASLMEAGTPNNDPKVVLDVFVPAKARHAQMGVSQDSKTIM